ncbi:chemotaxis protein CheW, partial [Escherichia coli]|nr:chemotaxis protein CheW [Escherichia coli]
LKDRVVGIVVDGVSDVLTLQSQQIKPAPEFSGALDTEYIRGLGSIDERMLILVDIERLLMSADMALCDEAEAA